jgi:hypothetical protein
MDKNQLEISLRGREVISNFSQLSRKQKLFIVPNIFNVLLSYLWLTVNDKFFILELLNHSFMQSRLKDQCDEYDFQIIFRRRFQTFEQFSLQDYADYIFNYEFQKFAESGKHWMFSSFMVSLTTTENLDFDSKMEALEFLYIMIDLEKENDK